MYDMMGVRCLHAHCYLYGNTDSFLYIKLLSLFNKSLKCYTFYQLHYDVIKPVIFTDIIYTDNIRMRKSRNRLSFTSELLDKARVCRIFRFKDFYCDISVQSMAECFINIRHSAGTDLVDYLIPVTNVHSCFNHFFSSQII